jgi:hypothetical protein
VRLPAPERFVWHKLYSAASRKQDPSKASKDVLQAATLAAVLVEQDDADLASAALKVPPELRRTAKQRLPALRLLLRKHPQALKQLERSFGTVSAPSPSSPRSRPRPAAAR